MSKPAVGDDETTETKSSMGYGDWISPISAANDASKKWKKKQIETWLCLRAQLKVLLGIFCLGFLSKS